ncbi:MAG: hypothetical protein K0Q94_1961 [Paenibacillus sp.]|nr:hypothetical protein [Paenibacillus sp.]
MPFGFRLALRNVYFRRLIISFSAITLVISCFCGAILVHRGLQAIDDNFSRTGIAQLNEVRTYMESTYLNSYKTALIGDVLSTINPDGPEDVLYSLYGNHSPNLYQIFRLVNHLKSAVTANEGIDGISIYFNKMGYIVDQDSFYEASKHSSKYGLIADLDSMPLQRWFPHTVSYGDGYEETVLTYAHTFPLHADRGNIEGYVFIDMLADQARGVLDALRRDPAEKLFMYSSRDEWAIGSSNVPERQLAAFQRNMESAPKVGKQSDGTYFSYIAAADPKLDWMFASVRPAAAIAPAKQDMYVQAILVCIGIWIIGIVLSYAISLKSYEPVRHMLIRLREMNSGPMPSHPHNEFKMVDHVLTGLNATIKQLTGQVDGNKLHALLSGHLLPNELPEYLQARSRYAVAKVRLENGSVEHWSSRFRHIPSPFPHKVVVKHEGELCILYYALDGGERESRRIHEHLAAVLEAGEEGAAFAAGIGSACDHAEGIPASYEQARQALGYVFIEEIDRIIPYEEICSRTEMPTLHYEPFEQALRAGNLQAVEQFIDEFGKVMKGSRYPLEAIELSLLQMTVTMSKVIIDMNNQESMFSSSLLFRDRKKETFARTLDGIRDQSIQIARHIQQHLLHNIQYETIYKLKAYIDSHLQEDVSLDRLAELASLSPQYISKQFKEVLQVSFIEYLTNARMERACELLGGSAMPVTEIAGQAGFNNVPYFCSKFKHIYGVTPIQYRKSLKKAPEPT